MRELFVNWSTLKQIKNNGWVNILYYSQQYENIDVYAGNHAYFYFAPITGDDLAEFESDYQSSAVEVESKDVAMALIPPPVNAESVQKVEIASRVGSKGFNQYTIATPNFCRKTTWYQDYTQRTDVAMTDSGDHTTYTSEYSNWINIDDFGIVAQEYNAGPPYYNLVAMWQKDGTLASKDNWRPVVKVNDEVQTNGYEINYASGSLTFDSPKSAEDIISATFRTVASSSFLIRPTSGKKLSIPHVEINCTEDMIPKTVIFEVYGGDPDYGFLADAYCGYRMSYTGNKALYGLSTVGMDRYNATGGTDFEPASAETGWSTNQQRGLANPLVEIPYDFGGPGKHGKAIILLSSAYHVMRMRIVNDEEVAGEYCSVTFYVEEDNE